MTRKEAIERIKARFDKWALDDEDKKAIQTLTPGLKENEDERIRKELIEFIQWSVDRHFMREDFHQAKRPSEWLAYLEKQKDSVSNNFDDVWNEEDCEEIIAEGQKLTPRFKELLKEVCHAWYDRGAKLEKQKEASKAIEAVKRIDKYIDEHLANAHDMKDSNPDKKYYRGWDDALGEMARILQDVYSGEKQKETLRDFIDNFPYSSEHEEQKPAEWSEEDEKIRQKLIRFISSPNIEGFMLASDEQMFVSWLKSLRPMPKVAVADGVLWKPSKHQMTILKAVKEYVGKGSGYWGEGLGSLIDDLEKL